jgi:hypothetical protein
MTGIFLRWHRQSQCELFFTSASLDRLGGGSILNEIAGNVAIGSQSVGHELIRKALVFGGDSTSATDIAVAAGKAAIGDKSLCVS